MEFNLKHLKRFNRVGVMGGTFDPVHIGHLASAEEARDRYALDIVIFIPCGMPPHKNQKGITAAIHRYNMVASAIRGNRCFAVSRLEIDRAGASYSIDTAREIKSFMREGAELFFIVGADAAALIETWKDYGAISDMARLIILPRLGHEIQTDEYTLSMPLIDVSASDIRARIIEGKSINYLLPGPVIRYIKANNLYKLSGVSIPAIMSYLERTLSKKRYMHTLGVYEEASKLARRYGADEKKTAIAAFLHDVAKDLTPREKFKACERYGIKLSKILSENIELTHPLIGCKIAAERFGIYDMEILNAIKYHTTGRKNMTLIEKVIYIADCVEPYREDYEGLEDIRAVAYKDLDEAMTVGLKAVISYTKHKGKKLHPLSRTALKYFEQLKEV